ncbi:hypothetical protein RhiirC2_807886, partial [Rhizophagus irregularis]
MVTNAYYFKSSLFNDDRSISLYSHLIDPLVTEVVHVYKHDRTRYETTATLLLGNGLANLLISITLYDLLLC